MKWLVRLASGVAIALLTVWFVRAPGATFGGRVYAMAVAAILGYAGWFESKDRPRFKKDFFRRMFGDDDDDRRGGPPAAA